MLFCQELVSKVPFYPQEHSRKEFYYKSDLELLGKYLWDLYSSGHSYYSATQVVMNIEWDFGYYQPWSDNEWLVDILQMITYLICDLRKYSSKEFKSKV